jgi:hypothetical protein
MNLNKYYGYVYVSADNVNSKYELSKVSEPNKITSLLKTEKKIKPSHEKVCYTIPMQRHLSFSVPTKHLSSWGDLFKSCFPLLFTTLVLNDSWTGGILNAQYLLLYCTHSK